MVHKQEEQRLIFSFTQPQNWEQIIAEVQHHYVVTRTGPPKSLGDTLDFLRNIIIAKEIIDEEYQEALSWACANLFDLYLVLSDPLVTEIFANQLENRLVVTHRRRGRCVTNLKFTREMWESLRIRAEYDTGLTLTPQTPALKVGFSTSLGELRISLQVEPLSVDGPILTLRRLPVQPITVSELVEDGFISEQWVQLLNTALDSRKNIIIAGEPGSGKTTLANALLEQIQSFWRVIILEDAGEIKLSKEQYPLLIRLQLPQIGGHDRLAQRKNEISRLLHRSPDYVFLGEIQNQEDTRVSFEAFAAGIRGMATTHARSLEGLLTRWKSSHELSKELLSTVDLIVIMERNFEQGKIVLRVGNIYQQRDAKFEAIK